MAKLIFKYGTMGAAKTAEALICKHRYEETGQSVLMMKPRTATRDGENIIRSRIGLSSEAVIIEDFFNNEETHIMISASKYNAIIVDEAQFLSKEIVDYLAFIVDEIGVSVICFGLKVDKNSELFEGSKRLLEIADNIVEIKTVCKCGKKAIFNVKIDSNEDDRMAKYISCCRKCSKEFN